jgi:hypothetical protein
MPRSNEEDQDYSVPEKGGNSKSENKHGYVEGSYTEPGGADGFHRARCECGERFQSLSSEGLLAQFLRHFADSLRELYMKAAEYHQKKGTDDNG